MLCMAKRCVLTKVYRRPGSNGIDKVPAWLWKHADLQKAIEFDKRTCVDLGQHDRCAVAQYEASVLNFVGLNQPRRHGGLSEEL
jgi:hypothetical protein